MAVLHMETEYVEDHGRSLLRTSTDMAEVSDALRYVSRRLRSSWKGGSAKHFTRELESVSTQIDKQLNKLNEISRGISREVREWEEVDRVKGSFSEFFGNINFTMKDSATLFAGGYLAKHLTSSLKRPNSMVFTGPNWMRKMVGIKEATRVIKPSTLVKHHALIAYATNVAEGVKAGRDTFLDPRYLGTSRAVPAAFADGLMKTAILAAGTTLLVGATALISTISAPALVVGGIMIGTWVVGGILLDKFVQTPLWQKWQTSRARDEVIEWGTKQVNKVKNYFTYQARQGAFKVKNAFERFRTALLPT